jgi:hypothetical protein
MTIFIEAEVAAIAAERERCAALVRGNYGWSGGVYFDDLADAILGVPPPDDKDESA